MHDDDRPIGRILSRREVLTLLGATGAALVAGRAAAQTTAPPGARGAAVRQGGTPALSCVVRPEQTEGPYFVDEKLDRSDIRSDPATGVVSAGVPLALTFRVYEVGSAGCTPLKGAVVDVWQCDAAGEYSDVRDMNDLFNTVGKKFLRGFQRTAADGSARFTTIYPGWYQGRAVHIHFKIRSSAAAQAREFTSQLYFDDALSDRILAAAPYTNAGSRVRNERDGIFRQGGAQLVLDVRAANSGYEGTFEIGLSL